MQAREQRQAGPHAADRQSHRAERRKAERAQAHSQRSSATQKSNPWPLVGGLAVIVAAVAVMGVVVLGMKQSSARATTSGSAAQAMVDKTALDPAVSPIRPGRIAPNFVVKHPDGRAVSLVSQRGHPVLLEFFAVWCPVCHRESSVIHRLTASYAPRGLRTLAVLANPYGPTYEITHGADLTVATPADLQWYAHTYKANYPLLVDPEFRAVNQYGAGSYPTLYVIDAHGKIAYSAQGGIPQPVLAAKIKALLK
jgi:peroxiredoxin